MPEPTESLEPSPPQEVRVVIPRAWYTRPWLLGLLLGVGALLVYTVRDAIGVTMFGFLLLALLYGINEGLVVRLNGRRATASVVTIVVLLVAVCVPLFLIVRKFVTEVSGLLAETEPQTDELRMQLQDAVASAGAGSELAAIVDELSAALFRLALSLGADILSGSIDAALYGIVLLLVLFFLLRDTPLMLDAARGYSPIGRDAFDLLARRFLYVTIGVFKGVIVVALVQSAIGGLTLYLVGVPNVWLWTILMAVLSLIPLVGTWLVMYPLAFVEIARGNVVGGLVIIIVTLFVITTVDNVLRPILIGHEARMHTLIALFATVGGMLVFGGIGVFLGPVIAALFIGLLELYQKEIGLPEDPDLAVQMTSTADSRTD